MTDLESITENHERAEAAFLDGLRRDAPRASQAELASELADVAKVWNAAAYRDFHAATGKERAHLDLVTERTEVFSEPWADVCRAYKD